MRRRPCSWFGENVSIQTSRDCISLCLSSSPYFGSGALLNIFSRGPEYTVALTIFSFCWRVPFINVATLGPVANQSARGHHQHPIRSSSPLLLCDGHQHTPGVCQVQADHGQQQTRSGVAESSKALSQAARQANATCRRVGPWRA